MQMVIIWNRLTYYYFHASITTSTSVVSGTKTAFTVSSDPSGSYSIGDNLYLQDGTNLGEITSLTSNSITIGNGINQDLLVSTILYKEGTTSTNKDTSKILEKNSDQLSIAYNIFNYNKTLVESAISTIETIAKQLNIKLVLES